MVCSRPWLCLGEVGGGEDSDQLEGGFVFGPGRAATLRTPNADQRETRDPSITYGDRSFDCEFQMFGEMRLIILHCTATAVLPYRSNTKVLFASPLSLTQSHHTYTYTYTLQLYT